MNSALRSRIKHAKKNTEKGKKIREKLKPRKAVSDAGIKIERKKK